MGADRHFLVEFSKAVEAVRHEDEAELFQRVLDIAEERDDRVLSRIAREYRDAARAQARRARRATTDRAMLSDSVIELARVASRHPSQIGQVRPPLAAV
jgi:Lon protease-like protein